MRTPRSINRESRSIAIALASQSFRISPCLQDKRIHLRPSQTVVWSIQSITFGSTKSLQKMTQTWEKSEFPILCDSCLGNNPYLRMLKDEFGRECKVCGRPFTTFKWCQQQGERWLKTEICQTCAKIKNACQTCILDLQYHLHSQQRDQVLQTHHSIPMSDVNSQVYVRSMEQKFNNASVVNHGLPEEAAKVVLSKLIKKATQPYQKRNRASRCAFYIKGNCKRDKDCPFLHEMPEKKKLEKHGVIKKQDTVFIIN